MISLLIIQDPVIMTLFLVSSKRKKDETRMIYFFLTICEEIHSKILFWKICHDRKTQRTLNMLLINKKHWPFNRLLIWLKSYSSIFCIRQDICIFKWQGVNSPYKYSTFPFTVMLSDQRARWECTGKDIPLYKKKFCFHECTGRWQLPTFLWSSLYYQGFKRDVLVDEGIKN